MNFPPYNAIQLKDILEQRSKFAFKEGCLGNGVVEKCAALAAREHGDARRALDLLRISGELAEREDASKVLLKHVDDAEEKIDKEIVVDAIKTLPKQSQITLLAIFNLFKKSDKFYTSDVSEEYQDICNKCGLKPLTHRRLSDLIEELDMLGIIRTKVISKGRYGRKKEIVMNLPSTSISNIIEKLKNWLNL